MNHTTPHHNSINQGTTMNFEQNITLVGTIIRALEQHIHSIVDARINDHMVAIRNSVEERINERMDMLDLPTDATVRSIVNEIMDSVIDEKMKLHTKTYDHDEYDEVLGNLKDVDFTDMEETVKNALRNML
jgi:hypothetical protein